MLELHLGGDGETPDSVEQIEGVHERVRVAVGHLVGAAVQGEQQPAVTGQHLVAADAGHLLVDPRPELVAQVDRQRHRSGSGVEHAHSVARGCLRGQVLEHEDLRR